MKKIIICFLITFSLLLICCDEKTDKVTLLNEKINVILDNNNITEEEYQEIITSFMNLSDEDKLMLVDYEMILSLYERKCIESEIIDIITIPITSDKLYLEKLETLHNKINDFGSSNISNYNLFMSYYSEVKTYLDNKTLSLLDYNYTLKDIIKVDEECHLIITNNITNKDIPYEVISKNNLVLITKVSNNDFLIKGLSKGFDVLTICISNTSNKREVNLQIVNNEKMTIEEIIKDIDSLVIQDINNENYLSLKKESERIMSLIINEENITNYNKLLNFNKLLDYQIFPFNLPMVITIETDESFKIIQDNYPPCIISTKNDNVVQVDDKYIIGKNAGESIVEISIPGLTRIITLKVIVILSEERYIKDINDKIISLKLLEVSIDETYLSLINELDSLIKKLNNPNDIPLYNDYLLIKEQVTELQRIDFLSKLEFHVDCLKEISCEDSFVLSIDCEYNAEFIYSVSDESILELIIDDKVEVFALSEGECTLFVSIKGTNNTKSFNITVTKKYVSPLNILFSIPETIIIGKTISTTIKVLPIDANQDYIITCSNDCLELNKLINNELEIKAVKTGETHITIKTIDDKIMKEINITVFDKNVNDEITLFSGVTREMTSPYYWIDRQDNTNELLLSSDEIIKRNYENYKIKSTGLVDLLTFPKTQTKEEVKTKIQKYTISSSYRINGSYPTNSYKTSLINETNINSIPNTVNVSYGLLCNFSSIRSFPIMDKATTSGTFDYFQETGLECGAGVIILHTSLNGLWYFVQAYDYYGWILAADVMKVTSEEFIDYLTTDKYIIVLGEEVIVGSTIYRMGTKLKIKSETDKSYVVILPNKQGFTEVNFSKDLDISNEYLPFTLSNLYLQAFKMLGNNYRWGDSDITGHDCSSTMQAIYATFGMVFGRNVSNQSPMAYEYTSFNSMNSESKKDILNETIPGTLAFISGHVVMYIGHIGDSYYLLHNFTSGGGCNITTTNLIRSGTQTYLEAIYGILQMK